MRILMSTECLRVGGAQIFALRLSKALVDQGHEVLNYYFYKDYLDEDIIRRNHPKISFAHPSVPFDFLIRKADRLLYKLRLDFSFRNIFVKNHQRKTMKAFKPDVVHSHMFQSDYPWSLVLKDFESIKFIITMHGSYETFMRYDFEKLDGRILNFQVKLKNHLARVNDIVYLTEKNLAIFNNNYVDENSYPGLNFTKIYNGFEEPENFKPLKKRDLIKDENSFVFGMVARGIKEKGWEIAIEAFNQLKLKNGYLLLIGDSEYVSQLRDTHSSNSSILFLGKKENPLDWINIFDIGLLPSFYGESLPNSIVEYMYCGKPVIATDIGECKYMIRTDGGEFGVIIPCENKSQMVNDLSSAMKGYFEKKDIDYNRESQLAKKGFSRFSMGKCLNSYIDLYQ